ncbi:MAG: PKHD-type hydroxylase [Halieaceae bacterium]|jgi:PKHD-type hydroxylase
MEGVFVLRHLLKGDVLAEFSEKVRGTLFADGHATASGMAASVKNNQQVSIEDVEGLLPLFADHVSKNPVLKGLAMPRSFVSMIVSRYGVGMGYGTHSDAAILNSGSRSDISFTLFISAKDEYKGGELVMETSFGEQSIRLDPGSMILYPTGILHRVNPVTEGERLVIVGWINSRIRDSRKRQMIIDLVKVRGQYESKIGNDQGAQTLLAVTENLRRLWDE